MMLLLTLTCRLAAVPAALCLHSVTTYPENFNTNLLPRQKCPVYFPSRPLIRWMEVMMRSTLPEGLLPQRDRPLTFVSHLLPVSIT